MVSSGDFTTRYPGYDGLRRVTASSQQFGADPPYTFGYLYNQASGLEVETYPSNRQVKTCYDRAGRPDTPRQPSDGGGLRGHRGSHRREDTAMTKFTAFSSRLVPLPIDNIDTDQIIPARFLKTISKDGLGDQLFNDWRYDSQGKPKPDFILNTPAAKQSQILLAGDNFGCGSSREHAPWALTQYGFRAVISTSFADIFRQNSLKNSLLPIVVPRDVHAELSALTPDAEVKVDLASQTITLPGGRRIEFPVDSFAKQCLLEGVDELGYILLQESAIAAYEAQRVGSINTLAPAAG